MAVVCRIFLPGGILCLLLLACEDYPRDPEGTWERIADRGVRIGVVDDIPSITPDSLPEHLSPANEEVALVRRMIRDLRLEVATWQTGPGDQLLGRLERFELDLVIGRYTAGSPWGRRVAFSRPWMTDFTDGSRPVLALPPGENRWLMEVDRWIVGRKDDEGRGRP